MYQDLYQGFSERKSLKAKIMRILFSMSKLIGHTEQKSFLHKNEAFYFNFLINMSSQHFKEPVCQQLYNIAHK